MSAKQSDYFAAPISAICMSVNAGWLMGYAVESFVYEDSVWFVAILVFAISWAAWFFWVFAFNLKFSSMTKASKSHLALIPIVATFGFGLCFLM